MCQTMAWHRPGDKSLSEPMLVILLTQLCVTPRHRVKAVKQRRVMISEGLLLIVFFIIDHDDVIKWKHFPRYWPFVRGIHRSPVNSPHKGQWRGALMFSLICVWINGWVNNREAGDLRCYRAHYDVSVITGLPLRYDKVWFCVSC